MNRYGDGVGLYRTHLFGSPAIIACFPSVNKFVFRSDDAFILKWPNVNLVGRNSLVAVHGKAHARLRSFVSNAINRPEALRRITDLVQPRLAAALRSWADKGQVRIYDESKKARSLSPKIFYAMIFHKLIYTYENESHVRI